MKKVCWIVGAGDFSPRGFAPQKSDFVIAADGGLKYLTSSEVTPDLILGDFDSLGHVPEGKSVLRFPPEKDDTDMMIAVKEGLKRGYDRFALYGGLGGRLGHTLANVQTLMYLARWRARAFLVGENEIVTAVTNDTITYPAAHSGYISVFCLDSPARGVTLRGLKYPLTDAVLESSIALGVSNEFTKQPATISVKNGTLVIVWDDGQFDDLLHA